MIIGYLGPKGSYSYEAAYLYTKGYEKSVHYEAMPNFKSIVKGVDTKQLDMGIIPVENSTQGTVAAAMDAILQLQNGSICGEIVLDIDHFLLTPTSDTGAIRKIYSHEQALEQCRKFISKNFPYAELIACTSTAQACELALRKGENCGAIASKTAAQLYGMSAIKENIQDNSYNQTRFLIISDKQLAPTGQDKTSIVFAFYGDFPGSLYAILKSFAIRDVNLTRIESSPAKHTMGKYIFYIDFFGHHHDQLTKVILKEIQEQVAWIKILGSYPANSFNDRK